MKLTDQFPLPVWKAGVDGKCDFFNKAWLDFTGRKLKQELGDGWASGVHSKDINARLRNYREAVRARVPFQLQYRLRRYDGEFRWVIEHGSLLNDDAGNFAGHIGVCYDITEGKKIEQTLQRSEHLFATFMDNLPGFAWMKDLEGRYVFTNIRLGELEPPRAVWLGKTDTELWPAEIADAYRANDETVIATRTPLQTVEPYLRAGEVRQALVSKFPIFGSSGSVEMVGGASIDITERLAAEQARRVSEQRFRELAANIREVFWLSDTQNTQMFYVSPAYETVWGRSCASLYSAPKSWLDAVFPEDKRQVLATVGSRPCTEPHDMTYRIVRPDGSTRWIRNRGFPVRNESGEVVRFAGLADDVTETKQAERALNRASRQLRYLSRRRVQVEEEERRHLALELHDHVGQLITAGRLNLQLLGRTKDRRAMTGKLNETIAILDQVLQHVRQISFDIRPPVLDDLGLAPAMRWMFDDSTARAGLASEFFADPNFKRGGVESETACYRVAQEAVLNVVRHAHARKVWLELRNDGDALQLVVRDDGIGFDVAAAERRVGRDRLGLVGMNERATAVGGKFECKSKPGVGTEVRAIFPVSSESDRIEPT